MLLLEQESGLLQPEGLERVLPSVANIRICMPRRAVVLLYGKKEHRRSRTVLL
jgi:hypothetical protein